MENTLAAITRLLLRRVQDLTVAVTNEFGIFHCVSRRPRDRHMAQLKTAPNSLFVPRVRRCHMAPVRHPLLILLPSSEVVATQRLSGSRYQLESERMERELSTDKTQD